MLAIISTEIYNRDITYLKHMDTITKTDKVPFSQLGITSTPWKKTTDSNVRNGARVYENEVYQGEIAEVEHQGKATVIRLENGKTWIYKFVDGSLNRNLFVA